MLRIRYTKTQDENVLQSRQIMLVDQGENKGESYRVLLDLKANKWSIIEQGCGLERASGYNKHIYKMKLQVKEALSKLGVPVITEVRQKRVKA